MGYLMLLGIGIHTYAWHGSPSVHSDYNTSIGSNAIDPNNLSYCWKSIQTKNWNNWSTFFSVKESNLGT